MKRLRHPIRAIREPFGTAGLIIACVALVAALGGSAIAASGGLTGKQKKEVSKIAQKEAKKFATAGPAGPQGSAGANGKDGAAGAQGPQGATGAQGAQGAQGVQGVQGKAGKEGETGFTETLPPEKTETGVWTIGVTPPGTTLPVTAPISFNIPLAAPLDASHVVYVKEGQTAPTECAGGTAAAPKAEPGFLCVYAAKELFLTFSAIQSPGAPTETTGASTAGALIKFGGEEEALARGTYAVTGELP